MPSFGGGGGQKGYVSEKTPEYEEAAKSGIYNRAGATYVQPTPTTTSYAQPTSTATNTRLYPGTGYDKIWMGQQRTGAPTGGATRGGGFNYGGTTGGGTEGYWDFSSVGQPITAAGALPGLRDAYNMGSIYDAEAGFRDPHQFRSVYNSNYQANPYEAAQFDFKSLPGEYYDTAYEQSARNLRRDQAGQLEALQEAIGVRRPGLLYKAAEDSQRRGGEELAQLAEGLGQERMRMDTDLAVQQQLQQAQENYRAAGFNEDQARIMAEQDMLEYQSRFAREQASADETYRYLQGLASTGLARVGTEANLVGQERDYADRALDYLMNLFGNAAGLQNQSAQIANQKRGADLGFLGNIGAGLIGAI